ASFRMQRRLEPRMDLTATDAHAGFVPAGYDPEFRCTIEVPTLTYPNSSSGLDPYKMLLNGEEVAVSLAIGASPYNKVTLSLPQAQLKDYSLSNEGAVPTVELVMQAHNSSAITQNNAVSIICPA